MAVVFAQTDIRRPLIRSECAKRISSLFLVLTFGIIKAILPKMKYMLKDIEYIRAVAREGSFSAAAASCFISQPALSLAVKRLEQELGVSLFERSTHSVKLSTAGELFLSEGENILMLSSQLKERMVGLSQLKKGNIRMGISTFYSSYYLTRNLPSFYRLHPGIKIDIV